MNNAIAFSAFSHPGRVRTNNEDNLYLDGVTLTPRTRTAPFSLTGVVDVPCLFAVCDGMGGEEDGELASLTAVTALDEHAEAMKAAATSGRSDEAVQAFVVDANKRLCGFMRARGIRMGTTLALAVITHKGVMYYTIGDSRIYALRSGALSQISEDHTLAIQKVKMGLLTPEQARKGRERHVLTRCLGVFEDEMTLTTDVLGPFPLEGRLLLCSDGLTDMVSDGDIEGALRGASDAGAATDALLDEALRNGGKDNVTCIVIDLGGEGA